MNALHTAVTGMLAAQTQIDAIAHNLANVNTTGFKGTRLSFEDLLYQQIGDKQSSKLGAQVGMGVAAGRTELMLAQGVLKETGELSNLAVEGNGFFPVELPDGRTAYTRDGGFSINGDSTLSSNSGFKLIPEIKVPANGDRESLAISATGKVSIEVNGVPQALGQIEIATFINPQGLSAVGDNLLMETLNSGVATLGQPGSDGHGSLKQGFVEGSNVSVMTEMIDMISAQRAFESISKVITTSDEMLGMANQMRR